MQWYRRASPGKAMCVINAELLALKFRAQCVNGDVCVRVHVCA